MTPDVVIIGSGMGGATLAAGLAVSGAEVLILERGERIPDDAPARDPDRVFKNSAFRAPEAWYDGEGRQFTPGNYYQVGGNSKLYGAVLIRYRVKDFETVEHSGGVSPAWPLSYETLAPFYDEAETLYQVRGDGTEDPTEPPRAAYPHPPVPDEPAIALVRARVRGAGARPFSLPLGVDVERWLAHGNTGWDGYPDQRCGKMDAETCGLAEALRHDNVTLVTDATVTMLHAGGDGRIERVTYEKNGERHDVRPRCVAVCCGAVQSAALLLRSGLGNDEVGRCFMNHNASALIAIDPRFENTSVYQKTFGINDWYFGVDGGPPLGNCQLLGRVVPKILKANVPWLPMPLARWISAHAVDLYAISEDLPDRDSRVTVDGARINLHWRRSNMGAHRALVAKVKETFRAAGFPIVRSRLFDGRVPSHQCGTVRMGADAASGAVDPEGRLWGHPNCYVMDAAALPTSAAVNPALTVAALSLRGARTIAADLS
ncbi:MAG: GMC family oxidoreductase [Pseudomonadota bacterium]